MGHRDNLLVTLNLSGSKNHGCRPHPRGSVRRASGFVLTGKQEGTEYFSFADRRPEWEQLLARMHREDLLSYLRPHMERACDIPAASWMGLPSTRKAYNLSSLSESRKRASKSD